MCNCCCTPCLPPPACHANAVAIEVEVVPPLQLRLVLASCSGEVAAKLVDTDDAAASPQKNKAHCMHMYIAGFCRVHKQWLLSFC